MPDISMCFGKHCPKREECYRAIAKPDKIQSYGDFEIDCELHNYRNLMKMDKSNRLILPFGEIELFLDEKPVSFVARDIKDLPENEKSKCTINCCKNCANAIGYSGYEDHFCKVYDCGIRAEVYNCEDFKSEG